MAVMGATEIDDILNLSASTAREDDFTRLILLVQDDICEYMNNWFEDNVIYRDAAGGIAFVKGAPDTITDDESKFSTIGFAAGMDVAVRGGSNKGIHNLAAAVAGTLTLDTTNAVIDQDQDATFHLVGSMTISRMDWPVGIKPYIAQMVYHRYDKPTPNSVQSERIDDYAVSFANVGSYSYPAETVAGLSKWRRMVLV